MNKLFVYQEKRNTTQEYKDALHLYILRLLHYVHKNVFLSLMLRQYILNHPFYFLIYKHKTFRKIVIR